MIYIFFIISNFINNISFHLNDDVLCLYILPCFLNCLGVDNPNVSGVDSDIH